MIGAYDFDAIERKWQARWAAESAFRAANPGEPGSEKPPYYVLDMFPYPSGAGLHIGHPEGYTATDIIARYKRMNGFNVLHPMGWDAFGLPAEQYAVEHNVHPRITTQRNIETFRRQLQRIGFSYDWEREFATTDQEYYRWTQWIFLKIYNSWYDPEYKWTDSQGRVNVGAARPIETLPIAPEVKSRGASAIANYQSEHRLAYLSEVAVNWCPALGTVLANEEVTNEGRSERGDHPVFRRPMKQWMMRITEYADRLLADLDVLEWPESTRTDQQNWIGRSEGAYVDFALAGNPGDTIRIYTTRPDTLFGATYMVLAPEHRLVSNITTPEQRTAVDAYVSAARQRTDLDRTATNRQKTGVFTGAYAINPANHARIPIWVADYVLGSYGTGSIMGVPGSDIRDLEFADAFGLPVVQVVKPLRDDRDWRGYEEDGLAVNSPSSSDERFEGQCELNGLTTAEAKKKIIAWLNERDLGEGAVQYKLRDWLFSRQRYWGEPFPILHRADGATVALSEAELPLQLPDLDDFRPAASNDADAEPRTPLSRASDWAVVARDGQTYRRELNTMPNWAGSCWYYLRFLDPNNCDAFSGQAAERYWTGLSTNRFGTRHGKPRIGLVDLYVGGKEHAVLHLLYARFWHKVLYDLGYVSTPEPFQHLFHQGMILSYAYRDSRGVPVHYDDIDFRDEGAFLKTTGEKLSGSIEKMSKTLKNVVNPDTVITQYGADTLRLYEMYMGPLEASKPWNSRDIVGVYRFLQRVWRMVIESDELGETGTGHTEPRISTRIVATPNPALERALHKTIKKVSADIESFGFNTAIAAMIGWVNEAYKADSIGRDQVERFLIILSPFAPHLAEELWHSLGHSALIAKESWPAFDEALTRDAEVEIAVQVNGKLRGRITIAAEATDQDVIEAAKALDIVAKELAIKPLQRAIVVRNRLVNLIV
jgi:leucyl-tRNA synthetase